MIDGAFEKTEMKRAPFCWRVGNLRRSNVPKRLIFRFEVSNEMTNGSIGNIIIWKFAVC